MISKSNSWFIKVMSTTLAIVLFIVAVTSFNSYADNRPDIRDYVIYNATTGKKIKEYSLSRGSATNNDISFHNIIGSDDRYENWSKIGVVKILTGLPSDPNVYGQSTGFVVDAHTIATAAHCLVKTGTLEPRIIEKILLFDDEGSLVSNGVSYPVLTPVQYHVPVEFLENNNKFYGEERAIYNVVYDYALITVKEDLSDFICFNMGIPLDSMVSKNSQNKDSKVKVTGFPKKINDNTDVNDYGTHAKYTGNGKIVDMEEEYIFHDIDVTSGNSGSPIYIEEVVNGRIYNTVIGIHVSSSLDGGDNRATRFTPEVLNFLCSNSEKKY
ncbi:MAG: trypsin-like peptidase domain-containing protein [Ruminococcus sp.]|nr:trypsin-like peptidase domain-containing protein [Ruminococcus sp.]MDE6784934.1 trypsin-like peptidase domain-containing protein [Ruminococcus sp.]